MYKWPYLLVSLALAGSDQELAVLRVQARARHGGACRQGSAKVTASEAGEGLVARALVAGGARHGASLASLLASAASDNDRGVNGDGARAGVSRAGQLIAVERVARVAAACERANAVLAHLRAGALAAVRGALVDVCARVWRNGRVWSLALLH